jgi:uncharacterized protein (TIGR02266 family)
MIDVSIERRNCSRLDVALRGEFSKLNLLNTPAKTTTAKISNLSAEGLFIETDNILPEGAFVDVSFCLVGDNNRVHAEGIVRWTMRNGSPSTSGMGVQFLAKN